jgi:hypothetical protein
MRMNPNLYRAVLILSGMLGGECLSVEIESPAPDIAAMIERLSSDDFNQREQAMDQLWRCGQRAEAALVKVANSADAEPASRARAILDRFAVGLAPNTPPEIAIQLTKYITTTVDGAVRKGALEELGALARKGSLDATVALVGLAANERNDATRKEVLRHLGVIHESCERLLLAGKDDAAARLLELAATSEYGQRHHAVYLLLNGGLDAQIRKIEAREDASCAEYLAELYRAKGDLHAAARVASRCPDRSLEQTILMQLGDWRALAESVGKDIAEHRETKSEAGTPAKYLLWKQRAAPGSRAELPTMEEEDGLLEQVESRLLSAAELASGQPEIGVDLQKRSQFPLNAFELLCAMGRYQDALAIPENTAGLNPAGRLYLLQAKVQTLYELGDHATGRRLIESEPTTKGRAVLQAARISALSHALPQEELLALFSSPSSRRRWRPSPTQMKCGRFWGRCSVIPTIWMIVPLQGGSRNSGGTG